MLGYQPGSDDMVAMTVLVICEVVSWTAVPLYAWLLVQGYRHTHSVVQYGIRLLALAIISEVPYDMATSDKVWDMNSQNPVFALVIALIVGAASTALAQCSDVVDRADELVALDRIGVPRSFDADADA